MTGNAYLLLTIAALFWAGNSVAGRLATTDWQPFTLTATRWVCASIFLLPFAYRPLRRDWPLIKANALLLFALGAFGMAGFNLLMFLALNYTTAINASIEQASMPMLIMLANFVFLSQSVRWLQLCGLGLTLLGVLFTATAGDPAQFISQGLNRGDALMLCACVFYAAYTFGLRWRPNIHWMSFMWIMAISALTMSLPFGLWELSHSTFVMPNTQGFLVLLYIIVFPTVFSQLSYARGVELLGGNRAGLFLNLIPIFGACLAVLILSEQFRWYHLVGLVLVLGGIALAESGPTLRANKKQALPEDP